MAQTFEHAAIGKTGEDALKAMGSPYKGVLFAGVMVTKDGSSSTTSWNELDFEKINQGLLLIGDWYTAKLYRIIYEEFYLDEWAAANPSEPVYIQIGEGEYEPKHAPWTRIMPHAEYRQRLIDCSLFVAHGGAVGLGGERGFAGIGHKVHTDGPARFRIRVR